MMTGSAATPIVFNQRMLRYYDRLLEFTCNRVRHCLIPRTLDLYKRHLSSNHLVAPIELSVRRFYSIAINYVLHCVSEAIREKGIAFANLKLLLNESGVLFGSTVLRHGVRCDLGARSFTRLYNARRAFCNLELSLADLKQALEMTFRAFRLDRQRWRCGGAGGRAGRASGNPRLIPGLLLLCGAK